jgi:FkbM family methyltransferase
METTKSPLHALLPKPLLNVLRPMWRAINRVREDRFKNYARESFSQEGEDLILERFLENRERGFYVDIGAHHPKRISNTYRLYRRGWRGINVDATPGSMERFKRVRPRDINIEAAVSATAQELMFYVFDLPELNTLDKNLAIERVNQRHPIVSEVPVSTCSLAELLDRHMPRNTAIDLLNIDVEGFDYDVLRSNDWKRYAPEFIFVECLEALSLNQAQTDPVAKFLLEQQYSIVAKTRHTVLFKLAVTRSTAATSIADKKQHMVAVAGARR